MSSVIFQNVIEWDIQEIVDLYRAAGWWEEHYDPDGIQPLIRGSFIFVVGICEKTGRAVAMGRIISDRVNTGYIQDLCVLEEFRGKQIGSHLLDFLIQVGRNAGLIHLTLIAEPDTLYFYEKSGFIYEEGLIFLLQKTGGTHEN